MVLNFERKGYVMVTMKDYIARLIDEAPVEWAGTATAPAGKQLFDVNEHAKKLEEEHARLFII